MGKKPRQLRQPSPHPPRNPLPRAKRLLNLPHRRPRLGLQNRRYRANRHLCRRPRLGLQNRRYRANRHLCRRPRPWFPRLVRGRQGVQMRVK